MKTTIAVIIGITLGLMAGILYPGMMDAAYNIDDLTKISSGQLLSGVSGSYYDTNFQTTKKSMQMQTRGISPIEADNLFQNYHQSRTPANSQGLLQVQVGGKQETVVHFFLDYNEIVVPLKEKIDNASDSTLVGFAGLLAYDSTASSHTLMWMAVVEDANNRLCYYLPENGDLDNETYIYDYIDVCPNDCPEENYNRLWNDNWAK